MSKWHPLLYNTLMVEGLLANRKTKTRRTRGLEFINKDPNKWFFDCVDYMPVVHCRFTHVSLPDVAYVKCPYGKPGDILWVRETWTSLATKGENIEYGFKAGANGDTLDAVKFYGLKWKPNIHMPKEACRIFLRIKSIKIERLNAITQEDAVAEGIEPIGEGWKSYEVIHKGKHKGKAHPHAAVPNSSPWTSFVELWQSINGPGSWNVNPWVWVIEFERISKEEAFLYI